MARGEIEELFERFREQADLDALAKVFDRAAPQLLSVARHLAGEEAAAEDLVQATFVAAIEHARRFERGRELVPWLVGILTNKAKLARALRAREPDRERLIEREERDPALEAELREFVAMLDQAIDRVPSRYRDVLRKHLGDGQRADQIASELGREPGTVRVQLHRAIAHLRRALPPGFAFGATAWQGAPRGLVAVRTSVLHHAKSSLVVSSSAAPVVIGGLAVNLKNLTVAAIALLAALGLWWSRQRELAPMLPTTAEVEAAPVAAERAHASDGVDPAETSHREAIEIPAPATVQPAAPIASGALDVLVVWHDGTPAPDIPIEVTPLGERQPNQRRQFAVTNDHGRASFDELAPGVVEVRHGHAWPTEPRKSLLVAGERESVQIELSAGIDMSGRVVDTSSQPVADASIWYYFIDESGLAEEVARSGNDGRFAIDSIEGGAWILAMSDEHGTSSRLMFPPDPKNWREEDGRVFDDIELVVDGSSAVIEGVVLDDAGLVVADARIAWLASPTRQGDHVLRLPGLPQRTTANGTFRFAGLRSMWGRLAVSVPGYAAWTESRRLDASSVNRFDVRLDRGLAVSGFTSGPDGTPLAGVKVAEISRPLANREFHDLWTTSDANGNFRLENIAAGIFKLEAAATIDGRERRVQMEFDGVSGGELTWSVQFLAGQSISGRALDPQSEPLVGWNVLAHANSDRVMGRGPKVMTDSQGRFEITGLAEAHYELTLRHPGHFSWVTRLESVEPGTHDVVLVGDVDDLPTAHVAGRVVDAHGEPLKAVVSVHNTKTRSGSGPTPSADGHFRIGPLQRGDLELWIECEGHAELNRIVHPIVGVLAREERDLGDIVVADPPTRAK